MFLTRANLIIRLVWAILAFEVIASLIAGRWSTAFISALALILTLIPIAFGERFEIKLPLRFAQFIVIFVFATLFLGEVGDFYARYWWWDVLLHGGSAIGFGLLGFVLVFMLFEGDRYAAPHFALAALAYAFAISIGVIWEIFEFGMDQIFGMNMQKSGLIDTMYDLIVNTIGAFIAAMAGYFYLKGRQFGGLAGMIEAFIAKNEKFFKRN